MKCCICGKEIQGRGHNPWGALDGNNKPIKFKDTDRCCDECDNEKVITGRRYLFKHADQ